MKKQKKVAIIGHFGFCGTYLDGQTIKTKILTQELECRYGTDEVEKIDTHGGKKVLLKMFFRTLKALRKCENIIILPAHNGIKFFAPLLYFLNKFFHKKIFYVVIGGWLPMYLEDKKRLTKKLKTFNSIFVETKFMKQALNEKGFNNIVIMPNSKNLTPLKREELIYPIDKPYRLCTFSRVAKEKGIEDLVNVVINVNKKLNCVMYQLDIYGQVDYNQTQWFNHFKEDFPSFINYCGAILYDQSVNTLKNYFALCFPTKSYTEGIPGTLIDAYASGIPVISSRWQNYIDVIEENRTGIGYEFDNLKELEEILIKIAEEPKKFLSMKPDCLQKAEEFITHNAIEVLITRLN